MARSAQAVLFSLALHGLIAGSCLLLAGHETAQTQRVYRVALADFATLAQPAAQPGPAVPEPVQPEPVQPAPPPSPPDPPEQKPAPEPEPAPVVQAAKKISPRKTDKKPAEAKKTRPAPRPAPRPVSQTPAVAAGPVGPSARNVGGISAYDSDHIDQRPGITKRVTPEYPGRARRMNMEGRVLVQVIVDTRGMPLNEAIIRATPTGYFEEAALKAVRRMRFSPGRLKGQAVNTVVMIPFEFRLR